ncbi:Fic family protein [Candidatus Rhabdochlamydia porcellionis]|uniref:Fic/DOC family n=1 Tax=Candidatus Rhabdochlamydia porcellionis TaxID=225148 RepID=A0ABX8YYF9_9BACT|nr:Fic family protein [Candidatus Rhabdochlamydia porcellionis]QZA58335.1 Fic/DOC family [Candidatus Rhabdochlamydia porcellionis]
MFTSYKFSNYKSIVSSPLIYKSLKKASHYLEHYNDTLQSHSKKQALLLPLLIAETSISLKAPFSITQLAHLLNDKPDSLWIDYLHTLIYLINHSNKQPLNISKLCFLHRLIKYNSSTKGSLGVLRTQQNWIGPEGCGIEKAYFLPPSPEEVPSLVNEWISFFNTSTAYPLIQLALAYGQFLIIHPFMDGNGRIARLLIPWFLHQHKLLIKPIFCPSDYFFKHRKEYCKRLFDLSSDVAWIKWINFFLKAITSQAKRQTQLMNQLALLYQQLAKQLNGKISHSEIYQLLDFCFCQPIFKKMHFPFIRETYTLQKLGFLQQRKDSFLFIPVVSYLKKITSKKLISRLSFKN